jgi:uncharacterized membrane protein (DUF106 family)
MAIERRKVKWYYNTFIILITGCIITIIITASYNFLLSPKQLQIKIEENRLLALEKKIDDADQKIKDEVDIKFKYIQEDIKEIKEDIKVLIKMQLDEKRDNK